MGTSVIKSCIEDDRKINKWTDIWIDDQKEKIAIGPVLDKYLQRRLINVYQNFNTFEKAIINSKIIFFKFIKIYKDKDIYLDRLIEWNRCFVLDRW